jgi:abhydrolase domain-containing protein 12
VPGVSLSFTVYNLDFSQLFLEILLQYLRTHYFTLDHISDITSPIMIAHARDDVETLLFNSLMVFDKLLEPLLPPAPPSFRSLSPAISEAEFESIRTRHQENKKLRDELVRVSHIKEDAMIRYEFQRGEGVPTLFLETTWGEHGRLPVQEGLQDVMREVFDLGTSLR